MLQPVIGDRARRALGTASGETTRIGACVSSSRRALATASWPSPTTSTVLPATLWKAGNTAKRASLITVTATLWNVVLI